MPVVINYSACLLLLSMTCCDTAGNDKPITCHAGTFAPGQPAAVTCNLQSVDNANGSGVHILRYLPGAPEFDPGENVLLCSWVKTIERHHCEVELDGYTFDNDNNNAIQVKIPAVRDEFAGLYMCSLVPPDGTQAHACDLIVSGGLLPQTTSTPETTVQKNETWVIGLIVIFITGMIPMAALGLWIFFWLRRRSQRHEETAMCGGRHDEEEVVPLVVGPGEQEQQRKPHPNKQIEKLVSRFRLTMDDLRGIMRVFSKETEAHQRQKEEARMKVYPTYLHSMPNGTEHGVYLVVNMGSTTLKILLIKLGGGNFQITSRNYKIEDRIRLGTKQQLFQFIADSVKTFLREHNVTEQRLPLAFVFSFTFEYYEGTDLTKARLVKWAKGFDCSDVVGRDVGQLLQESFQGSMANQTERPEMKAVVKDGVGVLVSVAHTDPDCLIGLVFGNGFNACYIQKETHDVSEGVAENHSYTVINTTEWGSIGENGCLDPFRTDFDTDLDRLSVNHNEQILEKMVSKAYIGEIARLVLAKLSTSGLLFTSNETECHALEKMGAFSTDYVSLIENDKNRGHVNTKYVLKQLGMENYTEEDCSIVSYVCGLISERSADLAAAALAALINRLNKPDITIAVDGSLYRSHGRFRERLHEKTKELINKGLNFTIKPSLNGSSKGAALIAAASTPQNQRVN